MTDPIADMLTAIRNATMARHETMVTPASKIKAEIAALLAHHGYISAFKIIEEGPQGKIALKLKYTGDRSAIRGIRRISKPGKRVYTGAGDLLPVLSGTGSAIISTNKGIMIDTEAKAAKVGGEVICEVW
jgi:small subunit ribosomal protein S8